MYLVYDTYLLPRSRFNTLSRHPAICLQRTINPQPINHRPHYAALLMASVLAIRLPSPQLPTAHTPSSSPAQSSPAHSLSLHQSGSCSKAGNLSGNPPQTSLGCAAQHSFHRYIKFAATLPPTGDRQPRISSASAPHTPRSNSGRPVCRGLGR